MVDRTDLGSSSVKNAQTIISDWLNLAETHLRLSSTDYDVPRSSKNVTAEAHVFTRYHPVIVMELCRQVLRFHGSQAVGSWREWTRLQAGEATQFSLSALRHDVPLVTRIDSLFYVQFFLHNSREPARF
ncbi:hypothetical protein CIHG_02662 [Coccidioides immitis H538.4]|uniref:Uncharacterized protein n=2 Tax=Coccidioides immitis TaxID=5501 RepID=A0A0J8RLQ0_COCIT|nr:hypothetical protein CIRG_02987 [Coccidioides immitis RMSCC 2394]KMU84879.1 hypothetical protein CIHG_02662 [Coccidioides immitis H538.4]